jgi:neutral ceramidase
MRAGYAEIDITPPPGEELTGYGYFLNRRATGALDPLLARAVALGDQDAGAVIVQLDLLGLSRAQVTAVRAAAWRQLGLSPERLLLHCTHTHTGPATAQLEGCGTPSPYFPPQLVQRLLTVIERALADRHDVDSATRFDADFAEGFAWNRVGSDELDTRVRGVELRCAAARPILIVSYACHPVTLGRLDQYSADYPGYLLRELNAYGLRALYLNGCCGDIDPVSNTCRWGAGTADTLRIYGRDLAAAVRRARLAARPWRTGPVQACSVQVPVAHQPLDARQLTEELAAMEAQLHDHPEDGPSRVRANWCIRMLEQIAAGTLEDLMTAEVQAIACGELVFVGLASEAFTRLGRIVRDAVPERHLLIAATANAVLGYLGTPEDARGSGYASVAAARIYGMAPPTPEAGVQWAAAGAGVVRQAAGLGP